tara:strand:+ start:1313 stop:1744 length:432 start_codon:yes stop_codon:yes gene_type:complete
MGKDLFWTKDEENTLKYKAGRVPISRLASSMGRSQGSVRGKAYTLGVSLRASSTFWSEDKLMYLWELKFSNKSWPQIAKELGVNVAACRQAYYRNRDTIIDVAEDRVIEQIIESLRSLISDEEILESIRKHLKEAKISDFRNF